MDAFNTPNLKSKRTPMDKVLLPAAGYDEDILHSCPPHDWNVARGRGVLMIVYTFMEAAVYSYVLHRLFAAPGELRPWLIVAGVGMALLVTIIDLELIIKPTAVRKGQQLLKRGGLDIGIGRAEIMAALLASVVRIVLALGISQLNGVFISTLVYNKDIGAELHNEYATKNAGPIAEAEAAADRTIQRVTQAEAEQSAQVIRLTKQLDTLRQTEIESPEIQEARNEVNRFVALKAKADEAICATPKFLLRTRGLGYESSTGNSGGRAGLWYFVIEQLSNSSRMRRSGGAGCIAGEESSSAQAVSMRSATRRRPRGTAASSGPASFVRNWRGPFRQSASGRSSRTARARGSPTRDHQP